MYTPDEINETVRAYIACALWATVDGEPDWEPLDYNYGPEDIAPDALAEIRETVTRFLESNIDLIEQLPADFDLAQVGHDLFLTRSGHGAGFWDRGLGDLGEKLSDAARDLGTSDPYVGDDGKVYVE